jgi:membrane-associated phospholipid phosphatase
MTIPGAYRKARIRPPAITWLVGLALAGLTACTDRVTSPDGAKTSGSPSTSAIKSWDANASADWNERATLLQSRRPAPPVTRLYTYLSLAQLRAAEDAEAIRPHPPTAAAIGAASAAILTSFFPADKDTIDSMLAAQASAEPWPGAKHEDFAAGAAIGRAAAARVLDYARGDRINLGNPGTPPTTPGHWVYSTPVKFSYNARPFFYESGDLLRPPPPPSFGSDTFKLALAEVLAITLRKDPGEIAIARYWMANQSLTSDRAANDLAVELIRTYRRSDAEAARILFLMNAAGFDASVGCYNAKYFYWYIRPSQADSRIITVFPAPAHPSYPSGHSCHSGSTTGVLMALFPSERERLEGIAQEASLSRLYAGIHYRFDMVAGLALGRKAAAKALAADLDKVAVR